MIEAAMAEDPGSDARSTGLTLRLDVPIDIDNAERIDRIRALEVAKCRIEATQAALTADFDDAVKSEAARRGVPVRQRGRGVAAQIALARRESHHKGERHVELARVVREEMPHTWAAWRAGLVTEWRATLLARETACLSLEHRRHIDAVLAADPARIEALGDGELVAEAKRLAYKLDPQSFVERRRRAEADRRVTVGPSPDVMSHLSALLPVKDGVAVYAVLSRHADTLITDGDARGRGQIMADTLVERILSPTMARDGVGSGVGVMINLIVSDEVLLGGGSGSAYVEGYGPVPADLAGELAGSDRAWLRRLFVRPSSGAVVAMDSRAKRFPKGLAELIRLRDQRCRTPWCDAPIRHVDHAESLDRGGETSAVNGQGLCEACNYAKEAFGWSARPRPGPRHTVETTTPTGHTYRSVAPEPPGGQRRPIHADCFWRPFGVAYAA
ncbi:MAG: DUF222 domain-containing protein [Nocardioides sp.]